MSLDKNSCDVTVVIPTFNAAQTLGRAISSISEQTLLPKSVILIDDKSTDSTRAIAINLKEQGLPFTVEIITNSRNLGPGLSRNIGWDRAETQWVAFLDADDAWHPKKLETQIGWMMSHPEVDMTATQTSFLESRSLDNPIVATPIELRSTIFKNRIPTRSVVIKQNISERFDSGLSEDLGLWLKLLKAGKRIEKIELPLAIHFRPEYSPGGASSKLLRQERYELLNIVRCFGVEPVLVPIATIFSILKFLRRVLISVARKVRA